MGVAVAPSRGLCRSRTRSESTCAKTRYSAEITFYLMYVYRYVYSHGATAVTRGGQPVQVFAATALFTFMCDH